MRIGTFLCILFVGQFGFSQGINFQASDWDEAREMARKQNKLIFIDAYTTWCAPCKVMEEYVFPHELGGQLHNEKFINLKMDMEDDIGPLLASRYGVSSYPTFLYLTWDGTLVYKSVGYQNIEDLVREGNTALQPYRLERAFKDRYAEGDRIPDFLYHLTYFRLDNNDPTYSELVPKYLETQSDWLTDDNMRYIFEFVESFDSESFKHMSSNKLAYADVVGATEFDTKYKGFVQDAMDNNGQPLSLERREEIYKVTYPRIADQLMTEYKLDHYKDSGDNVKYAETAFYYYTTYAADDVEGIAENIGVIEKYDKSPKAKKYVRNYYEAKVLKENSAKGWLKIAKYYLADRDFVKAKELGKQAKKLAKTAKENQDPYKAFLKKIKVAEKSAKKK